LKDLSRSSDRQLFYLGVAHSVLQTFADVEFSSQVYANQLTKRLGKIEKAAVGLIREVEPLTDPGGDLDRLAYKALAVAQNLDGEDGIKTILDNVRLLVSMLRIATYLAPRLAPAKTGRPRGVVRSGMALTQFIARLELSALIAGGGWTLNKNDGKGTLITALEELRGFLPETFLPALGAHPYSTYQKILTGTRSKFPSLKAGLAEWNKTDP
jgi:hypothetical protein